MQKQFSDEKIDAIREFIRSHGGRYSEYYIGITDDLDRRLFEEHRVRRHRFGQRSDVYKGWDARIDGIARMIEKRALDEFRGIDGGTGGGSSSVRYVYIFKKTQSTDPSI